MIAERLKMVFIAKEERLADCQFRGELLQKRATFVRKREEPVDVGGGPVSRQHFARGVLEARRAVTREIHPGFRLNPGAEILELRFEVLDR